MSTEVEALRTAISLCQAGQWSQAELVCRQILDFNPQQPDAWHLLGQSAHQSGHHESALQYISQAIAANPVQPTYHISLGEAHLSRGRVPEARACFEQALQIDGSCAAAHYNLGRICEAERPAEAQQHYQSAIALAPDHALAHCQLGSVLLAQGKADEGIAEFRAALACQPNCAEALSNLGAAKEHLEHAVRLQGQSAEAHLNLGLANTASANWDRAIPCFQNALRLDPDSFLARRHLADALRAQSDIDAALAVLVEGVRRRPDHVDSLLHYGSLLQTAGRAEESLESAHSALRIDPDSAAAHYNRAEALQDLNRFEEAKEAFRDAIRRQPHYPEAYAGLAILCLKNTSHLHKCIFIHIPKNGGTTIKSVLDMPGGGHRSWKYYATNYPRVWQNYASFAVVRNPWDRAVSAYHHARMKESQWHNEQLGLHADYRFLLDKSFAECVSILCHERHLLKHESWLDESHFIVDEDSPDKKIMVDTVLRFETLSKDFADFCRTLGIHCTDLPTVNRSPRSRDYRSYYDDRTRRMIEQVYRSDIDTFGYTF